jgi:hypothetical protein
MSGRRARHGHLNDMADTSAKNGLRTIENSLQADVSQIYPQRPVCPPHFLE